MACRGAGLEESAEGTAAVMAAFGSPAGGFGSVLAKCSVDPDVTLAVSGAGIGRASVVRALACCREVGSACSEQAPKPAQISRP
jgi:hypothetical protein